MSTQAPKGATQDEARELAKRWAWWHTFDSTEHDQAEDNPDLEEWLASIGEAERVLLDDDRERLFAWVRERVRACINDQRADEDEYVRAYPDSADDRHEASVTVAHELGLVDSRQFPDELATTLCEAAGWPS